MLIQSSAVLLCLAGIPAVVAMDAAATFVARAYSTAGRTADGGTTKRGIVAADPRVLPLGTRVLLTGAGPYNGEYAVRDTGGSIKGNRLDVYIPTRAEALRFGVRKVIVTILKPFPDPPRLPVIPPARVEMSMLIPAP